MTKIFIVEDESQGSNTILKYPEVRARNSHNTESHFVVTEEVPSVLPNDGVACEIQMPELNTCGFIRVLYQGSVIATIPFSFLNAKTSKPSQQRDMDLTTGDDLNQCSLAEELLVQMANLKNLCIYITQLVQLSAFNLQDLLSVLSAQASESADNKPVFPPDALLNQVFEFINNNYHQAITLTDVAQAVGYSGAYLTNLVRRQTGKTVNHWIIDRRMKAARTLLLETNQSANQIALTLGYQHEGHFFRQFRQHHGTTPLAWRKMQRS